MSTCYTGGKRLLLSVVRVFTIDRAGVGDLVASTKAADKAGLPLKFLMAAP